MDAQGRGKPEPDGGANATGNRLSREKSPYLLQHATNPVNWYPWGDEAFRRAAREDKPVFLSIGYSTCHWCHVMAHESFTDTAVAEVLNRDFVSIKVDREERPDIDSTYMQVCQMLTGQGGWPLTIIMTPEKQPFFAATYLPRDRRFAMPGLLEILPQVARAWQNQRKEILQSSHRIADGLRQSLPPAPGQDPDLLLLDEGYEQLVLQFDPEYGGFGSAPKFPTPHLLLFLLRYAKRTGKERATGMVKRTLDAMLDGGIHDHIGGGFHRYSTDARWRVPHFEKMLYDQALLLMAFTEAFQVTGSHRYRDTAEEIIAYVLRDLTSPEGAFLSAEDADSPGGEGAFYLWTEEEMIESLGSDDGRIAALIYGIRHGRNEGGDPAHGILHRPVPPDTLAGSLGLTARELAARQESLRARLFSAREQRQRPFCDDKVLTDWNGLFVAALAMAARTFGKEEYRTAAVRAASFLLSRMRSPDGALLHRYRDNEAAIPAFADDYAFCLLALIELYETTFDPRYLAEARDLGRIFAARFADADGGFYSTDSATESPLGRRKEIYDGAIPSANSVACDVFLRLSSLTGDPSWSEQASALARCFTARVRNSPGSYGWFLCALERALGPSLEIVIAGKTGTRDMLALTDQVQSRYLPGATVLFLPGTETAPAAGLLREIAPFTRDMTCPDGRATAFVCSGKTCSAPVTDPGLLGKILDGQKEGA